jgi:glycosyltransferase involved in cell wall biosynthesis
MTIPVLYISGQLTFGGAENQLLQLLLRLDRKKFFPIVCNLTEGGGIEEKIKENGIWIVQIRKKSRYSVKPFIALAQLIRASSCKIVHTIGSSAHLWGTPVAKALGVPVILYSDHQPHFFLVEKRGWRSRLIGWISRLDNQVIAHCKHNESGLHAIDGVPLAKTRVIYNGVDVSQFRNRTRSYRLHSELGITQTTQLVCMIARFDPQKAYDDFIEALRLLNNEDVDCHFLCIGDGFLRPAMEKIVSDQGLQNRITFLGSRKDVPEILADCDIVVLASHHEGLPITILEAMASGLPVVVSDVGGCKEAVIHDETGFLIPPGDSRGMAQAIEKLIENKELARSMGQAGSQRVGKYFDIAVNCQQIQELYLELLNRNNTQGSTIARGRSGC